MPIILRSSWCFVLALVVSTHVAHATEREQAPSVRVFVADWCIFCRRLERWLKAESIPYERLDIEKSRAAQREYDALGRGGIPLTFVGQEAIRGFDVERIRESYSRQHRSRR